MFYSPVSARAELGRPGYAPCVPSFYSLSLSLSASACISSAVCVRLSSIIGGLAPLTTTTGL